jgi:hypothetical protein
MKLKSENRSSKSQIRNKPKKRNPAKSKPAVLAVVSSILPSDYEFVSDFEFRIRELN